MRHRRNPFIYWYICNSNFGWRKESFFTGTALIGTRTLWTLISPCYKYSGLERLGFLVHDKPCFSQKVQENVVHRVVSCSSWPYEVHMFVSSCNLSWTKWNKLCEDKYWNKFRYSCIQFFSFSDSVIITWARHHLSSEWLRS